MAHFFAGLIVTGSIVQACDEAGVSFATGWACRKEYPVFAAYRDRAVRVHRNVMAGVPYRDAVADEAGAGR